MKRTRESGGPIEGVPSLSAVGRRIGSSVRLLRWQPVQKRGTNARHLVPVEALASYRNNRYMHTTYVPGLSDTGSKYGPRRFEAKVERER